MPYLERLDHAPFLGACLPNSIPVASAPQLSRALEDKKRAKKRGLAWFRPGSDPHSRNHMPWPRLHHQNSNAQKT